MTVKDASYEVTALQSNRPLTDGERKKVAVLLHTATGSWDWNNLSAWSAADLREWGMDKDTLSGWGQDYSNLNELLGADSEPAQGTGIEAGNQFGVIVICDDAPHQESVYNALVESGYKVKVVVV